MRVDAAHSQGFGLVDAACVSQHEWFRALRAAGFTRLEGLYIVTRPSVEMARLQWINEHPTADGDL